MSRIRTLWVLAFLGVAILGVGVGALAERRYHAARLRAAQAVARDLVGLNDPVPPAPAWEEWLYPKAKTESSIRGTSLRVAGEPDRPAGRYAVLSTPDSFEDVARFYAEQCGFTDPAAVAQTRSGSSSEGGLLEFRHFLDDMRQAGEGETPRPLRAKCLIRRGRAYDLTVFISRADGEAHTHIVLLYDPRARPAGD